MKRFLLLFLMLAAPAIAPASELPPAIGPAEPMALPIKGDDGLYHRNWFEESCLDLKEDFPEARKSVVETR